jgi:hypothetical protein
VRQLPDESRLRYNQQAKRFGHLTFQSKIEKNVSWLHGKVRLPVSPRHYSNHHPAGDGKRCQCTQQRSKLTHFRH